MKQKENFKKKHLIFFIHFFLIGILSSCALGPTPSTGPLDHLNHVSAEEHVCSVVWDSQTAQPSPNMMNQLQTCLKTSGWSQESYIDIRIPLSLQVSGQGDRYAAALKESIRSRLRMSPARISWDYQAADLPEREGLVFDIHIQIYHVTPPHCGSKPFVMGGGVVEPWVDLGCSNAANLGLMIQDPRDLVTSRSMDQGPVFPLATAVETVMSAKPSAGGVGGASGGAALGGASGGGSSSSSAGR